MRWELKSLPFFIPAYRFGTHFSNSQENGSAMQIIILGNPFETASALDSKRLNEQISLCDRLIKRLKAGKADKSLIAFQGNLWWLQLYCNTLDFYNKGMVKEAAEMSYFAERYKPSFLTDAVIAKNRQYLAKRDPLHYSQWL